MPKQKSETEIVEGNDTLLVKIPYEEAIRNRSNNKQLSKKDELALVDYQTLCVIADQLLAHAPGLIDWKNQDCEFLGCNYGVVKVSGISSPQEMIGKIDEDFSWGGNGQGEVIRSFDRETMKGYITFDMGRVRHVDKLRLLCAKKIPLLDAKKRVVGILDYLTEIDDSSVKTILTDLSKLGIKITLEIVDVAKKFARKDNQYSLSERQKECLYYLIRGATSKEIAKELNISQRTIEDYISIIKDAFQCQYKSLLIKKAIEMGFMDVLPERFLISQFITDSGKPD